MQRVDLQRVSHSYKVGSSCDELEPNVCSDCFFVEDGEVIGFYLRSLPPEIARVAAIANNELLSERVPKSNMSRSSGLTSGANEVEQFSTIIGSCAPKPHMKRPYPTKSSVHAAPSARRFILSMLKLVSMCEDLLRDVAPHLFDRQLEVFKRVDEKWKFGRLFTSSISNYNAAAPFHIDAANIPETVNFIITKRRDSIGGDLCVPDYGAVLDCCDSSLIVYPAWRNLHGVTPIRPISQGGYRNSLVFYPLKAFLDKHYSE